MEIRRWMESHAPVERRVAADAGTRTGQAEDFERWLAASVGIAKGRLTTDERMRETRGED